MKLRYRYNFLAGMIISNFENKFSLGVDSLLILYVDVIVHDAANPLLWNTNKVRRNT